MSCLHPILALDYGIDCETGKHLVRMLPKSRQHEPLASLKERYGDMLLELPCGKCINCAQSYARTWAVRILLEASLYQENCFLTLTFNDAHIPSLSSDLKRPVQLFLKRLRKAVDCKIRFFCVGETGEESGRFHYHLIIFNYSFPDKVPLKKTSSGQIIYRSPLLEKCWSDPATGESLGISSIGDVSPKSASYVARYSLKKQSLGVVGREFVLMSRRPGLGAACFDLKWFDSEKLYTCMGESSIPRFYHKLLEAVNPSKYEEFKAARVARAKDFGDKRFLYGVDKLEDLYAIEEDHALHRPIYRGN